jgi:hypothetical protein
MKERTSVNVTNPNYMSTSNPNYVNTNYLNTSNAVVATLPDKKKNLPSQENEKINENGVVTNSNAYFQTNVNNTNNEINKPNKLQVNQTNYKFIDTINNNNDRNNTAQAANTIVHLTNNDKDIKNSKLHTSINKSL